MDEGLSWRAMLAKANINILDVHDDMVFVEFTYHPKPGVFKWCKTVFEANWLSTDEMVERIMTDVLALRKELEG